MAYSPWGWKESETTEWLMYPHTCTNRREKVYAQSCQTLVLPGSSVCGISQARIWERTAFPSPGDLPDPGIEPMSAALQADSLSLAPCYCKVFVSRYPSLNTVQLEVIIIYFTGWTEGSGDVFIPSWFLSPSHITVQLYSNLKLEISFPCQRKENSSIF